MGNPNEQLTLHIKSFQATGRQDLAKRQVNEAIKEFFQKDETAGLGNDNGAFSILQNGAWGSDFETALRCAEADIEKYLGGKDINADELVAKFREISGYNPDNAKAFKAGQDIRIEDLLKDITVAQTTPAEPAEISEDDKKRLALLQKGVIQLEDGTLINTDRKKVDESGTETGGEVDAKDMTDTDLRRLVLAREGALEVDGQFIGRDKKPVNITEDLINRLIEAEKTGQAPPENLPVVPQGDAFDQTKFDETIGGLNNRLNEISEKLNELTGSLENNATDEDVAAAKKEVSGRIDGLNTQLSGIRDQLDTIGKSLANKADKEALEALQESFKGLETKLTEFKETLDRKADQTELETKINEVRGEIADVRTKLETLTGRVDTNESGLNLLREQFKVLDDTVKRLDESLQSLEERVTATEEANQRQDGELTSLREENARQDSLITANQAQIRTQGQELAELKLDEDAKEIHNTALEKEAAGAINSIHDSDGKIIAAPSAEFDMVQFIKEDGLQNLKDRIEGAGNAYYWSYDTELNAYVGKRFERFHENNLFGADHVTKEEFVDYLQGLYKLDEQDLKDIDHYFTLIKEVGDESFAGEDGITPLDMARVIANQEQSGADTKLAPFDSDARAELDILDLKENPEVMESLAQMMNHGHYYYDKNGVVHVMKNYHNGNAQGIGKHTITRDEFDRLMGGLFKTEGNEQALDTLFEAWSQDGETIKAYQLRNLAKQTRTVQKEQQEIDATMAILVSTPGSGVTAFEAPTAAFDTEDFVANNTALNGLIDTYYHPGYYWTVDAEGNAKAARFHDKDGLMLDAPKPHIISKDQFVNYVLGKFTPDADTSRSDLATQAASAYDELLRVKDSRVTYRQLTIDILRQRIKTNEAAEIRSRSSVVLDVQNHVRALEKFKANHNGNEPTAPTGLLVSADDFLMDIGALQKLQDLLSGADKMDGYYFTVDESGKLVGRKLSQQTMNKAQLAEYLNGQFTNVSDQVVQEILTSISKDDTVSSEEVQVLMDFLKKLDDSGFQIEIEAVPGNAI